MPSSPNSTSLARPSASTQHWARVLSLLVIVLGVSNLIGWWLDISVLKSVLPGLVSLKPNAAVSLVMAGISLSLLTFETTPRAESRASMLAAGIMALIGLVTLSEYFFGWNAGGFDQWLHTEPTGTSFTASPGRMPIIAASLCVLQGITLFLVARQKHWTIIQSLALFTTVVAALPVVGYMFGKIALFAIYSSSGIAAHASLGFLAISVGTLLITSHRGFVARLLDAYRHINLIVAIVVLLLAVLALIHSAHQRRQAVAEVERVMHIQIVAQSVKADIYLHKADNRTYLLTGNRDWLTKAEAVRKNLRTQLNQLTGLVAPYPTLHKNIQEVDTQIEALFFSADRLILLRDEKGYIARETLVVESETDGLNAAIASQLEAENIEFHIHLQQKKSLSDLRESISNITLGVMLLGGLLLLTSTFRALNREIALRAQVEETLRNNEDALKEAQRIGHMGSWQLDAATWHITWSEELFRMYGFDPAKPVPPYTESEKLFTPESWKLLNASIATALQEGTPYAIELEMMRADGSKGWMWARGEPVKNADGKVVRVRGVTQDITKRKQLEIQLEQQAHEDYLTGVNNRRHFMALGETELSRAVRYDKALSILMMDIDFFKRINDTHGHKVGDHVLQKLAKTCRATLREIDIIGRLGGEEFAVLLPETDHGQALEAAERLRVALEKAKVPQETGGLPIHFSVSIGVATLASESDNLDVLLNLADKALYEAKEAGRNQVRAAQHGQ